MVSGGFLSSPQRPKGHCQAIFRSLANPARAHYLLESNAAVLQQADEIVFDLRDADPMPSSSAMAELMDECRKRFSADFAVYMKLDQISLNGWAPEDALRICGRAAEAIFSCDAALARALEIAGHAGGQPAAASKEIILPHELASLLTGAMKPGARIRFQFADREAPGPAPFCVTPFLEIFPSLPLEINFSPAVASGGLRWMDLGETLRKSLALAPALAGAWQMTASDDLRQALRKSCPAVFSIKGWESLFQALKTSPEEARARQWMSDIMQFAQGQVAQETPAAQAARPEWDYRPVSGWIVPDMNSLTPGIIQAQFALQKAARHPLRIGFRCQGGVSGADILQVLSRSLALGAREVWMTTEGRASMSAGETWMASDRSASIPKAPRKPSDGKQLQKIPASSRLAVPLPLLPLPASKIQQTKPLPFVAQPNRSPIACDRCGTPMRRTANFLWCPKCHFVLSGQ
ncbi:MAG: hypothetical protein NTX50_11535 [Candidatus Sumerlaeota bacterium]|nr:hypothetical protein [Candidatus Sumerlaeota bacterium]